MANRRGFLFGSIGALAAPSIVRAESLMKLWVPTTSLRVLTLPELEHQMLALRHSVFWLVWNDHARLAYDRAEFF